MKATLDRTTLKANEPATLTVTISGEGNLKLLEEPVLNLPAGIEKYDPKIEENIERGGGRITGTKSFEYVLVPRFPGKLDIAPIAFTYYNVASRKYVTLNSSAWTLTVQESEQQEAGKGSPQYGVRTLARDIHPLKSGDALNASPSGAAGSASLFLLYLLPFAMTTGALVYKRRWDRIHGDATGLRMRRSTRIAEKHLATAKAFLQRNDIDAYYLEIARALWGYMQNRLAMPTSDTSTQTVAERLAARSVPADIVANVQAALVASDEARYSPTRASESEMRGLYDTARNAIVSVEQALKA
jgi:hypothetical protein